MRLPDEYDEHSGMTPTVITTIVVVTMFVAAVFIIVLIFNSNGKHKQGNVPVPTATPQSFILPENDNTVSNSISGSTLRPEDLDFWDMYPTETPSEQASASPSESASPKPQETTDPATDGKHTLVQYADGKEEWVLISPYLPKHEYDFTKLVCQSNIMKYYVDGRQTSYVGVDISKYQDYVDFVKLKKAGINYVMIRVGARGYGTGQLIVDDNFSDNIKRATDAGLQVGVYFSSQAITEEEAVEEANLVLENIAEYRIDYPVAFDMGFAVNDTARIDVLSRADKTKIAKAFLDTIEQAGYIPLLYGNKEWLVKEIDMSKLTAYDVWLTQIADVPDYPYRFTMWQYSDQGSVDGISGYVNLNISFVDYKEK